MKSKGIIIVVICLAGIIAAAYSLGLFGNGKPVQEAGEITVQTPRVTSGTSGRVTMYLRTKGYNSKYLVDGLVGLAEYLRGDKARDFVNSTAGK